MSNVLIDTDSMTAIGNAIRGKNGSASTYKPAQMAAAITAIPTPSGSLPIDSNGTYDVTAYATAVVSVAGSSKNVQVAAGVSRATTSSYAPISGQSLTVGVTGTYDVYWSGFRSSTSGTSGSQLYVNSSAYGTAQTTFTNHGQSVHLTNVSLTKNQTVQVFARSRGSGYYMYVANLTIIQTS